MLPKLTIYNLIVLTIFLLLAIITMYPNCLYNNILEGNTSNTQDTSSTNKSVNNYFSFMEGQGSTCGNFSKNNIKKWDASFNKDDKYQLSVDGNCMDYCNYKTYEILKIQENNNDNSNNPTSWVNICKNKYKSKNTNGKIVESEDISGSTFNWIKFKDNKNSFINNNFYSDAKFCPYTLKSSVDTSCSGFWNTVRNLYHKHHKQDDWYPDPLSKKSVHGHNISKDQDQDQEKLFGSKADRAKCNKHIDSTACNNDTTCCWSDTGCMVKNSNTKQLCGSSIEHEKKHDKNPENSIDKALDQELSDIKHDHSSNHNKALGIIEKLLDSILGNSMNKDNGLGSYPTSIMNNPQISGSINSYNRDNSYSSLGDSLLEGEDNNFKNSSNHEIIPFNSCNFSRQF